jgi:5-oxoprolinase (ATP-hydrolysing)/N-methylhydantoinase A
LFGGQPGGAVRGALIDTSGAVVEDYGIGGLVTLVRTDQVLEVRLAGGSGYGDPLERPIALVQADLDNGSVSAEGAARDYGCVIGADGRIDAAATAALRARRGTDRSR